MEFGYNLQCNYSQKEALKDLERCLDKQQDLFQILQVSLQTQN